MYSHGSGAATVDRGKHRRCIELRKHVLSEAEPVVWREGNTDRLVTRETVRYGGV